MLGFWKDGKTLGTLGGGCVEAEVPPSHRNAAGGRVRAVEFSLDHDYGWDDGMIAAG
jgi:xanthine/CO dehydrogenase XdhC/CoxF family maturation factor